MPLIILIAVLVVLRFLEVWKFAGLSWGWIVALMVAAFVWFEFIERVLGVDKRKQHASDDKRRQARVANAFGKRK